MPSVVDICNYALAKVGEQSITSLDDGTPEATKCKLLYPFARDFVLRAHPWNCTIKRKSLASSTTDPVYEFVSAFNMPSDLLRLLDVDLDNDDDWRVESKKILADVEGPLKIRYVGRIDDPNSFDTHVIEVIACYLALQLVESLTQSNTKKQLIASEYEQAFALARRSDAQEDSPAKLEDGSWLKSRI